MAVVVPSFVAGLASLPALALLMASHGIPERIERLIVLLPTGLKSGDGGPWSIRAESGLPGSIGCLYEVSCSREAPFIRGWLSKFALGDSARVNGDEFRALTLRATVRRQHADLRFPPWAAGF